MRRLIDNVFEEEILRSVLEQARLAEKWTNDLIKDRSGRIAELDKALANPDLRNDRRRDLKTWRTAYSNEIKMLVNKNKLKYE